LWRRRLPDAAQQLGLASGAAGAAAAEWRQLAGILLAGAANVARAAALAETAARGAAAVANAEAAVAGAAPTGRWQRQRVAADAAEAAAAAIS